MSNETAVLWRIATQTSTYAATDLSGTGARLTGGRWNSPGRAVVYTSTSMSLAVLETVVHLKASSFPFARYLVRLEVPHSLWKTRRIHGVDEVRDHPPAMLARDRLRVELHTPDRPALDLEALHDAVLAARRDAQRLAPGFTADEVAALARAGQQVARVLAGPVDPAELAALCAAGVTLEALPVAAELPDP